MELTPIINVRQKMPKDVLHALNMFETKCVVTKVKRVSEEEVRQFLLDNFGEKVASKFKTEYLFQPEVVK